VAINPYNFRHSFPASSDAFNDVAVLVENADLPSLPEEERINVAETLRQLMLTDEIFARASSRLLFRFITDESSRIRETVASAMGSVGFDYAHIAPEALETLACLRDDKSPDVRAMAACSAGCIGQHQPSVTERALALLDILKDDEDTGVRRISAIKIGKIGSKYFSFYYQTLNMLRKMMPDPDQELDDMLTYAVGEVIESANGDADPPPRMDL